MPELNESYAWGDYFLSFSAVNDGEFTCLVELLESPLPPAPRLVNFADIQAADPSQPLELTFEFEQTPASDDFLQVYVNLGHEEVWATPSLGEPGALSSTDRTVTIPPGTLVPGFIHSLNLEITRIVSTNSECYPHAQGVGAMFTSTELDLIVFTPPTLALLSQPTNGVFAVTVIADPEQPVVLEASENISAWTPVATNAESTGTNEFRIPLADAPHQYFRALLQ
jgi:hypothetical protein